MSDKKTEIAHVDVNNAQSIMEELEEAFFDIPFDNSSFQTENFVIAGQMTPERAYRSIGLSLQTKLHTVQTNALENELRVVEREELEEKLNSPDYDKFEKRRFEIKLRKMKVNENFSKKLFNDAITELNLLYKHFKSMPKFTREQFEAGEKLHYFEKLKRQANNLNGGQQSLINMFDDREAMKNYQKEFLLMNNEYDDQKLLELAEKTIKNVSNPGER